MTALLARPTLPTPAKKAAKKSWTRSTSEKVAVPMSEPHMVVVFDPKTNKEVEHFGYEAKVRHTSKRDEMRTVLCSRLDIVRVGEPVLLVYHHGMKAYKHNRHMFVSNPDNCSGGFYFINGVKA